MDNAQQLLNIFVTRGEFDTYKTIVQRTFNDLEERIKEQNKIYDERIKALEDVKAEYETKQQSKTTKKDK